MDAPVTEPQQVRTPGGPPTLYTIKYKSEMAYVAPAATYDDALELARTTFPKLRRYATERMGIYVIGQLNNVPQRVAIGRTAYPLVLPRFREHEVLTIYVSGNGLMERLTSWARSGSSSSSSFPAPSSASLSTRTKSEHDLEKRPKAPQIVVTDPSGDEKHADSPKSSACTFEIPPAYSRSDATPSLDTDRASVSSGTTSTSPPSSPTASLLQLADDDTVAFFAGRSSPVASRTTSPARSSTSSHSRSPSPAPAPKKEQPRPQVYTRRPYVTSVYPSRRPQ
ncbi:uncharacterized protein BXZ73DRAFT_97655 [Epithele typhae]|uniref:uncharacterized protein n=1 Tax=Epithele typhae TaxID=378194 RepID=UPI0020075B34|nr:uncharacterized protein BXZ73DRAFT_97655 [Epithele typhae]KAH9942237.1 hypothetical protein BXZ73DRAFT_97655 [Epithele typhae]